jgi:drug/metabolite transporter superfamily protein YnfA
MNEEGEKVGGCWLGYKWLRSRKKFSLKKDHDLCLMVGKRVWGKLNLNGLN